MAWQSSPFLLLNFALTLSLQQIDPTKNNLGKNKKGEEGTKKKN